MRRRSSEVHAACVEVWLARAKNDVDPLLALLDEGVRRIWRRAELTLGEVTITAIAERVMHDAARRHPVLSGARLDSSGLSADGLRRRDGSLTWETLEPMASFLLVELLAVIGSLTNEILTPALHAELSEVAAEPLAAPGETSPPPRGEHGHGDD